MLTRLSVAGLLLAACVAAAPADAQSLEGTWLGSWVRDGAALAVTMRFERTAAGYRGSFDSEGLRVVDIPLADVVVDPPRVRWQLIGDATTSVFEGRLAGRRLEGRFREGEAGGRFELRRSSAAPARARREEISFRNGAVSLSGTVLVPSSAPPHPGIVFLHGSGAEGRWASLFLAEQFAARGFVALCFDKRGVGRSGGDWRHAGLEDLAGDGAAAVAALAARSDVSAGRIGIHGHSQGGLLAPLTAARAGPLAFVIASAAGGVPPREMETYSIENNLGVPAMTGAEADDGHAFTEALVATAYDGAPREALMRVFERVRSRPWAFEPPPPDSGYWSFGRQLAGYDPLAHWRRVAAPVLLVYGEADQRVPVRRSAARIAEAYLGGRGRSLAVLVFAGADHTLRMPPAAPASFAWPVTVPGYPSRLVDWALAQVSLPAMPSAQPGLDAAHVP